MALGENGVAICIRDRSAAIRPYAHCDNSWSHNPSYRRQSVAVARTGTLNPLCWSGFREKRSHIQAEDLIRGLARGLPHGLARGLDHGLLRSPHDLETAAGAGRGSAGPRLL